MSIESKMLFYVYIKYCRKNIKYLMCLHQTIITYNYFSATLYSKAFQR